MEVATGVFKQTFLGEFFGIGLIEKGVTPESSQHVSFMVLIKQEDRWHYSCSIGSSAWLLELAVQIHAAIRWCEKNCEPDIHGWKFKV